jgi:hypothetical protein
MRKPEIQHLILLSNGDRALDNFLEIHIFGSFDANAVEEIFIHHPLPNDADSIFSLKFLKEKANKLNKRLSNV